MRLSITGRHFDITPALEQYIQQKFNKLNRHCETITTVQVICGIEKLDQTIEASITVPGDTLFARTHAENMYKAVDLLVDKLDRQVIKTKQKQSDHRSTDVPASEV